MSVVPQQTIYEAAKNGNLEIIKWIHNNNNLYDPKISEILSLNGQLDLYKWMHGYGLIKSDKQHVYNAVKNGHLEMVKWFINMSDTFLDEKVYLCALANGHVEIAKLAYDARPSLLNCHDIFVEEVIANGQLESLKWMTQISRLSDCMVYCAIDNALHFDKKEIFSWLFFEYSDITTELSKYTSTFINMRRVYLAVYMYENHPETFTLDKIKDLKKVIKYTKYYNEDANKT